MKFVRIVFRCFGPFEDQPLELSSLGGFHVIFGPNEAGKSSAMRICMRSFLGFPASLPTTSVSSMHNFAFKPLWRIPVANR